MATSPPDSQVGSPQLAALERPQHLPGDCQHQNYQHGVSGPAADMETAPALCEEVAGAAIPMRHAGGVAPTSTRAVRARSQVMRRPLWSRRPHSSRTSYSKATPSGRFPRTRFPRPRQPQSSSSDCARRRSTASLISWSTKIAMAAMRCLCSGLSVL